MSPIIDDDYQNITSFNLHQVVPGRTVKSFNLEDGEIHFEDGSVLSITWFPDSIGYELLEDLKE